MRDYHISQGTSSSYVDLGVLFVEAFGEGEVFKGQFGTIGLEVLQPFHEVRVGPLLLLYESNSA